MPRNRPIRQGPKRKIWVGTVLVVLYLGLKGHGLLLSFRFWHQIGFR